MQFKGQGGGFWGALLVAVVAPFIIKALEGTEEHLPVGLKWAGDAANWLWAHFMAPVPLGAFLFVGLSGMFLGYLYFKMTLENAKRFTEHESKRTQLEQSILNLQDVIASRSRVLKKKDERIAELEELLKDSQETVNVLSEREQAYTQSSEKLSDDELLTMSMIIHSEVPLDYGDLLVDTGLHRIRLDHAITSLKNRLFIQEHRPGSRAVVYFRLAPAGTAYAVKYHLDKPLD